CYGHLTPIGAEQAGSTAAFARPLERGKAWREMIHRYAAGTLALVIVSIAALAIAARRSRPVSPPLAAALLGVVVFQALLGMLTVTWQLKPLIVTAHLLFGMTTLALLEWLVLSVHRRPSSPPAGAGSRARRFTLFALAVLAAQIALGGWTSSNYAAIACPDFPGCQGSGWPQPDFRNAFVLWRGLDIDYEGGVLGNPARIAIHLTHRLGALAASAALAVAAVFVLSRRGLAAARPWAWAVLAALVLQLSIGIAMVVRGFPLWVATAHTAGAALLLMATLALLRSLSRRWDG
ncbi:MAG: COX15/CtaA family protein, partial [Gammaproteobacteria bacterium]|nr:COX15/CtaA family protein [Gammaproteobacteria bacterium]